MDNNKKVKLDTSQEKSNFQEEGNIFSGDNEFENSKQGATINSKMFDRQTYVDRLAQDSKIIENIFPALMWTEKVFHPHLSYNPANFENFINSSPFFRELLKDNRVLYLFEKALKIIYSRNLDAPISSLTFKELLNWRLVCSSWCSSIDQLLEEYGINHNHNSSAVLEWCTYKFNESSKFYTFFEYFEQSHSPSSVLKGGRSPFIVKSLRVDLCSGDAETRRIWKGYISLFKKYGHHVIHLNLTVECISPEQDYLNMRELLIHTPNLKSLKMHFGIVMGTNSALLTEAFVETHPLPRFAQLIKFDFNGMPPVVLSSLLRQNDHILILKVSGENEYNGFKLKSKTLSHLDIDTNSCFQDRCVFPWKDIRWSERFQMISDTWGSNSTLENLQLRLTCTRLFLHQILNDSLNGRLILPNVKMLILIIDRAFFSLDFLLGMSSLERITVISSEHLGYNKGHQPLTLEAEQKQIVEWISYEKRLEQSNIWTLFKNLKRVECYCGEHVPYNELYTRLRNGMVRRKTNEYWVR